MINVLVACMSPAILSALICSVAGASIIKRFSKPLTLVAIGFLTALSLSHIIPEAMEMSDPHTIGFVVLITVLTLTGIEMCFSVSGHDKHTDERNIIKNGTISILTGSFCHTFCDGLVIASAFLANENLGYAVTVAVLSHEVAHELGDYAIMLENSMSVKQAYIVNIVAFTGLTLGGILGYLLISNIKEFIHYALALSGASFIYVSLSDLLPRLKSGSSKKKMILRFVFILLGVIISLAVSHHD